MLVYGKEPWICRAMLVYGRVSPTHEVIPPFTLNLSGFSACAALKSGTRGGPARLAETTVVL